MTAEQLKTLIYNSALHTRSALETKEGSLWNLQCPITIEFLPFDLWLFLTHEIWMVCIYSLYKLQQNHLLALAAYGITSLSLLKYLFYILFAEWIDGPINASSCSI